VPREQIVDFKTGAQKFNKGDANYIKSLETAVRPSLTTLLSRQ